MTKFFLLFSIIGAPLAVAGCTSGPSTGTQQGTVMSCFQGTKSGGLACIDTPNGPETQPQDVDDDGKDDTFVCADRDRDDDGVPDFEDHDDGSGSGSSSGSSADDGSHGGSDGSAGSGSGGSSHDGDDDGIDDSEDCGNIVSPPPPPPV